jgi:XTP/dITP diphosphohydrolase
MDTLLIATSNPAKLDEIHGFLKELPIELVSLSDLGIPADAPEDAETFKENAIMKAEYYAKKSGLPTIADDGGFEIDALNGEPGVKSHRWIEGRETSDEERIAYTLKRLEGVPIEKRGAQLHLVLAFSVPRSETITVDTFTRGIIPFRASENRTQGFPYRSLLYLPEIQKFYDHTVMTCEETEKYNHRGRAVRALMPEILSYFDNIK